MLANDMDEDEDDEDENHDVGGMKSRREAGSAAYE